MVGPYCTTLAGYSLAVNAERFLLEDPASHSILSLHPAVAAAPGRKPTPCLAVAGFATGADRMEVTWQAVDGIEAVTLLRLTEDSSARGEGSARLLLSVRFRNTGPSPAILAGLHPLHFPAEGPGACALGREDLRTLASRRPDGRPRLLRLDGPGLVSRHFGAWFAEAGSPALLLAGAAGEDASLVFRAEGARGKMLALSVDWETPAMLGSGEALEAPAIELVMGRCDIHEELRRWAERANAAALVPEFRAGGEIVDEEPEPEPQPEAEPAACAPEPQAEPEVEAEPQPAAEAESEPMAELESESQAEPVASTTDEVAPNEEVTEETVAADEVASPSPESVLAAAVASWGRGRCAAFQRAMRATRSFEETGRGAWPRWASGRRYQPVSGMSLRTRGYWRMSCPPEEPAGAGS